MLESLVMFLHMMLFQLYFASYSAADSVSSPYNFYSLLYRNVLILVAPRPNELKNALKSLRLLKLNDFSVAVKSLFSINCIGSRFLCSKFCCYFLTIIVAFTFFVCRYSLAKTYYYRVFAFSVLNALAFIFKKYNGL